MKKTLGLLVSTSILLGLTACGGGSSKGDSNAATDPTKLTYDGKTELVDLELLDGQQRKELAAKAVEYHTASAMTEVLGVPISIAVDSLHELIDEYSLTAGQQQTMDYSSIEDYCGGSGSLKVSSDFQQSTVPPRSLSEVKAESGTLEWKIDNLCYDDNDLKASVTAELKETYRENSNTADIKFKSDIEFDNLKQTCDVTVSLSIEKEEYRDKQSFNYAFKCSHATGKIVGDSDQNEVLLKLNSGEKSRHYSESDAIVELSSYGKFGLLSKSSADFCYDTNAKITRMKSGSLYLLTLIYDTDVEEYGIVSDKSYRLTVSQPDSNGCTTPTISLVKEAPAL